jgi:hypothetical protein
MIVRGHEIAQQGYEFPFSPDKSVVTVFSCPNYPYECQNHGAVLIVDKNLACSWRMLRCREAYETFLERIARESETRIQAPEGVESPESHGAER